MGGAVSPSIRLHDMDKENFNFRTPDRAASTKSLYRLRLPDSKVTHRCVNLRILRAGLCRYGAMFINPLTHFGVCEAFSSALFCR